VRVGPAPSHQTSVPGEECRRCHAEACPAGAGEQPAERGKERPVCGLIRGTTDLASEHGDLVAQHEQLDVVGALGASRKDGELQQAPENEVDERPEPATHPVPSHRGTVAAPSYLQKSLLSGAIGFSDSTVRRRRSRAWASPADRLLARP
jgi:hypothetical protein